MLLKELSRKVVILIGTETSISVCFCFREEGKFDVVIDVFGVEKPSFLLRLHEYSAVQTYTIQNRNKSIFDDDIGFNRTAAYVVNLSKILLNNFSYSLQVVFLSLNQLIETEFNLVDGIPLLFFSEQLQLHFSPDLPLHSHSHYLRHHQPLHERVLGPRLDQQQGQVVLTESQL